MQVTKNRRGAFENSELVVSNWGIDLNVFLDNISKAYLYCQFKMGELNNDMLTVKEETVVELKDVAKIPHRYYEVSLDMCNGWFGFENAESRVRVFEKIPGSVAVELAKLTVLFSGIHILPDGPEKYNKKSDLFDYVKTLPDTFDEFKVLDGDIDEFVTVGRRKGNDWYIGSLTNRDGRQIVVNLNFLEDDANYEAIRYEDADDSHFLNNQESYKITKKMVSKGDVFNVKLAPGGGTAIQLIKQ